MENMSKNGMKAMVLFLAALLASASYYIADVVEQSGDMMTVWKASGVTLLALWAACNARSFDGWLLVAVLAFGAAGDALIEIYGLRTGGSAFAIAHLVAIWLFWKNRRVHLVPTQKALATLLHIAVPLGAIALAGGPGQAVGHGIYGLILGIMAGTAWASRFSRYRVGMGAVLFVISDLLIFSRSSLLAGSDIPDLFVWPLYFTGQALIAWGVVTMLSHEDHRETSTRTD